MSSDSDRLTKEDVQKLLRAKCKNHAGQKADQLALLDNTHAMLVDWVLQSNRYEYVRGGEASIDNINAVKERTEQVFAPVRILQQRDSKTPLPTRAEFREVFAAIYHLLKDDHDLGKFYRNAINQAFATLGIAPVRDIEPPGSGKNVKTP